MKINKIVNMLSFVGLMLTLSVTAKSALAVEKEINEPLRKYLEAMLPTEQDKMKCKGDTECISTVRDVSKLSPNLQFQFVLNASSETLPPEITNRLPESYRNFDNITSTSNTTVGNSVTVTDNGPVSGNGNPQKIIWGQLLDSGFGSNPLPQKNSSYFGANDYEPTGSSSTPATPGGVELPEPDGEMNGQSGTTTQSGNTNPSGQSAPWAGAGAPPRPPYVPQDKWEKLTYEQKQNVFDFFVRIEAGTIYKRGPGFGRDDRDPTNIAPIVTPERQVAIQKFIQSHLGGKRPGATDPMYRRIGDQAEPVYNRPLTKEEQKKLNQSIGQGGFNRTRDVWAGASVQKVAPTVTSNPRPAPVETCVGLECNQ